MINYFILSLVSITVFSAFEEFSSPDWASVPTTLPTTYDIQLLEMSSTYGTCICDLTENQCDFNCICDPDCSTSEKNQFFGPLKSTKTFIIQEYKCANNLPLWNNLQSDVSTSTYSIGPFWGICVFYETNPALGRVYAYTSPVTDDITYKLYKSRAFSMSYGSKKDFITTYAEHVEERKTGTTFVVGDLIAMRFESNESKLIDAKYNKFSVPSAVEVIDGSGTCVDRIESASFVKFQMKEKTHKCVRELYNPTNTEAFFENICVNEINPQLYIDRLWVYPSRLYDTTTMSYDKVDFINVEISEDSKTYYGVINTPISSYQKMGNILSCLNALGGIKYKFVYDLEKMSLKKVVADVVLRNFTFDISTITAQSRAVFEQKFNVDFMDEANFNLSSGAIREKSGNPGYIQGKKVLYGRFISENSSPASRNGIAQRVNGLEVLSGLDCSDGTKLSVKFKHDMFSACRLKLSKANLKTLCVNKMTSFEESFLWKVGNDSFYAGKLGNANLNVISDWVRQLDIESFESFIWDETKGKCSKVKSMVNFDIVIVRTGFVRNEQWKIIGIRKSYTLEDWVYNDDLTPTNDFFLKTKVTFIEEISQFGYDTKTPVRNILDIPGDWFYPLKLVFGESSKNSISFLSVVVIFIMLLFQM